ncbi:MAG: DUF2142 domain-containing protein [Lachnospiraceae bacterium]|nr:DUF2142 domain-containing protein [Lachnospiraceae bacterium]
MKKWDRIWLAGVLVLALLGFWHLGDVRAGAAECGDTWLIGWYFLLFAAVLGTGAVFGWLFLERCFWEKKRKRTWKLEEIYPVAGLFLGLLYLFVLPPLSAPDEISHYISAYQLSGRLMGLPSNSRDGHVLVRAQDWFLEDVGEDYIWGYEDGYRVKEGTKDGSGKATVLGEPLVEKTYRLIHDTFRDGQKNRQEQGYAVSPYPPVVTTPAAYLPQAAGICLARILGLSSLWLAYLGRLGNLLFFVAVTWLAMKRMPFGKEVLFGVALLPMTLHLSASFSYDVWIMAGIFYFTALCLDLAFEAEQVKAADVAALGLVMALVGPCKMVYAVFMGLCLLIPVRKFGGWGKWALSAGVVFGAWAIVMVLINGQTVAMYVAPETEHYIGWAQETGYSLGMLVHQPRKWIQLFFNTAVWQAEQYHLTMIGAYLGNLDPVLDVPYVLVMALTGLLLCLAFKKPGEPLFLTGGKQLWIWTLCFGCVTATMLSMLLAWTPVDSPVISGVQGRYFLPFLPVFLMSLKNDMLVLTRDKTRGILYTMCCVDAYVILRIYSVVSMRL